MIRSTIPLDPKERMTQSDHRVPVFEFCVGSFRVSVCVRVCSFNRECTHYVRPAAGSIIGGRSGFLAVSQPSPIVRARPGAIKFAARP